MGEIKKELELIDELMETAVNCEYSSTRRIADALAGMLVIMKKDFRNRWDCE